MSTSTAATEKELKLATPTSLADSIGRRVHELAQRLENVVDILVGSEPNAPKGEDIAARCGLVGEVHDSLDSINRGLDRIESATGRI